MSQEEEADHRTGVGSAARRARGKELDGDTGEVVGGCHGGFGNHYGMSASPSVENHSGVFTGTEGGARLSSQQGRELVGRGQWVVA